MRTQRTDGNEQVRQASEVGPAHYAQIQDPETFFRELGEQAAEQIDQMQTQLTGPSSTRQ